MLVLRLGTTLPDNRREEGLRGHRTVPASTNASGRHRCCCCWHVGDVVFPGQQCRRRRCHGPQRHVRAVPPRVVPVTQFACVHLLPTGHVRVDEWLDGRDVHGTVSVGHVQRRGGCPHRGRLPRMPPGQVWERARLDERRVLRAVPAREVLAAARFGVSNRVRELPTAVLHVAMQRETTCIQRESRPPAGTCFQQEGLVGVHLLFSISSCYVMKLYMISFFIRKASHRENLIM